MTEPKRSRRGVYYDLSISPYEFKSPYGDVFRFSSKKKLEIYTRDIPKEMNRLEALIERNDMKSFIPDEIQHLLFRKLYEAFYSKVEG